jgi:hypothetical protein
MVNVVLVLQDSVFIFILLALMTGLVFFLSGAVRAGYRRAMIEHMRNMTESPRMRDSSEKVELEDIPKKAEQGNIPANLENEIVSNKIQNQQPGIHASNVRMLAPNTAQYGRSHTTLIPSIDGIPLSAFPNIEMRNPWSLANIEAAEVPEKAGCRKTVTGVFYDCGVPPANSCE